MSQSLTAAELPRGSAPAPVPLPHFPDRLHACVWRCWGLIEPERLAAVLGAEPGAVVALGRSMGLPEPPPVTEPVRRRVYITVIRRLWHLLPYEQLLELLGWSAAELDYALREDDFLFVKLGYLKPECPPLRWSEPGSESRARAAAIARVLRQELADLPPVPGEPLFDFVRALSEPPPAAEPAPSGASAFSPRYCCSYFALYGDPLLETEADPFPDGYLARLAAAGVDGVWLQAVLYCLAPFPWAPALSLRREERVEALRGLVERARRHGLGVYLYLNEPRAMPRAFFRDHPEGAALQGVEEPHADQAALCTSVPAVREYLEVAVEHLCRAVPDLAGLFTITASENLTNCWSRRRGHECPRCRDRTPAAVIAEVNTAIHAGMRRSGTGARLIAWDWGWPDEAAEEIIRSLPPGTALQSVSEWSLPLRRGGVETVVGEYSISAVGPGPRALRHWAIARERGLPTIAKIQANVTWELAAVPYLPVVTSVARHAARLRAAGVDGLMLGWTLGGCPSPNLEVVAELGHGPAPANDHEVEATALGAVREVAGRRFGEGAGFAVTAWELCSAAFAEFPYHGGTVYTAPLQYGPSNLLWEASTGYRATMLGFPYDDLERWRSVYPAEVFIDQLEPVAVGFEAGASMLRRGAATAWTADRGAALEAEARLAEAAAIHFRSTAQQARFVQARNALEAGDGDRAVLLQELEAVLRAEIELARRLLILQRQDSRLGFEASNHYFYVPQDLAEKIVNCRDLLDRWLPGLRPRP